MQVHHFKCDRCQTKLQDDFFSKDNKVFCARDYAELYNPKCVKCSQATRDKCASLITSTIFFVFIFICRVVNDCSFASLFTTFWGFRSLFCFVLLCPFLAIHCRHHGW